MCAGLNLTATLGSSERQRLGPPTWPWPAVDSTPSSARTMDRLPRPADTAYPQSRCRYSRVAATYIPGTVAGQYHGVYAVSSLRSRGLGKRAYETVIPVSTTVVFCNPGSWTRRPVVFFRSDARMALCWMGIRCCAFVRGSVMSRVPAIVLVICGKNQLDTTRKYILKRSEPIYIYIYKKKKKPG